jgi:hypothetical protein
VKASDYLHSIFGKDQKTEWLADLVMHKRHNHIQYYNNGVGYVARFHNYERFKEKVNNRVKRQIIRKHRAFLIQHEITVDNFSKLQSTDEDTIKLAKKSLWNEKQTKI